MTDIHPGFVPRALKALPFALNGPDQNQKNADVEKAKAKSILSFFGKVHELSMVHAFITVL